MCGTPYPVERAHLDKNYCTIFTRVAERLQCGMGSGKFWLMQVRTTKKPYFLVYVVVFFHQLLSVGNRVQKNQYKKMVIINLKLYQLTNKVISQPVSQLSVRLSQYCSQSIVLGIGVTLPHIFRVSFSNQNYNKWHLACQAKLGMAGTRRQDMNSQTHPTER